MKPGTSFLLGVFVGLSAGLLFKRLQHIIEEDQPEKVFDRISESLAELERRAQRFESQISPN